MKKKKKMKGFPISEWQKAKRKPTPIELPPMEDDVDDVIVDKHSRESVRDEIARLRRENEAAEVKQDKCGNCYGQGRVPDSRFCGSGKACSQCKGTGLIEIEVEPELITVDLARLDDLVDGVLPILPGDVDYVGPEPPEPPKPPRKRKPRKRKAKKRVPTDDDIPPWEKLDLPGGEEPAPWD